MACSFCSGARQYAFNMLLLADLSLNTTLAGSPRETLSSRTSRARSDGSLAARAFCVVLTWIGNNIFCQNVDHCDYAIEQQKTDADEVWHWSAPPSE